MNAQHTIVRYIGGCSFVNARGRRVVIFEPRHVRQVLFWLRIYGAPVTIGEAGFALHS